MVSSVDQTLACRQKLSLGILGARVGVGELSVLLHHPRVGEEALSLLGCFESYV